jgi:ATP-dependent Clp protease adaptor protein ClpS
MEAVHRSGSAAPNLAATARSTKLIGGRVPADGKVAPERCKAMATRSRDGTVLETKKSKVKTPPLFKVILLNDDYTPMEFVVIVLQTFFGMTREKATQVMLKVHREGMGVCGVYPRDIATTKVEQVVSYARKHQHPLQCVMEET